MRLKLLEEYRCRECGVLLDEREREMYGNRCVECEREGMRNEVNQGH
jgi:DNA-directed RNA polymerase subunit RPC12/RpoP